VAELHVEVDGQVVPLAACDWVFSHSCGHPFGVLVADLSAGPSREVFATEDQAWREFYPRARDRAAAGKRGVTARLAVHAELGDEFWQQMRYGCGCVAGRNRRG
jgi:hypothetical protein